MYDLRELVSIGRTAKVSRVINESDTSAGYSKGMEELMASPAAIGLAMQASAEAIDKFLPDGYISIGRQIDFEHTATTMIGVKVTVEATVADVQPLFIILDIKATDELGEIGHGTHRRSIVNMASLLRRAQTRKEQMINSRR